MIPSEFASTVIEFAASPAFREDGICFAACQRGLLHTIDHGKHWFPTHATGSGLQQIPTTSLAISPAFAEDKTVFAAIPGGIGRSQDIGATWKFVRLPDPAPVISSLAISPDFTRDKLLFAGTAQDGMFRSDNAGETWSPWNSGLFDLNVLAVRCSPGFVHDHTLIAGTTTGIFRSLNAGRSWHPADISTDRALVGMLGYASSPSSSEVWLYAETETAGLHVSADSGSSWHPISGVAKGSIDALATSADGESVFLLDEDGIVRTNDGGATWQRVENLPVNSAEITSMTSPSSPAGKHELLLGTVDGSIHHIALTK